MGGHSSGNQPPASRSLVCAVEYGEWQLDGAGSDNKVGKVEISLLQLFGSSQFGIRPHIREPSSGKRTANTELPNSNDPRNYSAIGD